MVVNWPDGYARRILTQVDSTNAEAARIADTLCEPTWILARVQTAARGRRGRPWVMAQGNFAATLVLRPTETADVVALRSFVAALALHEAIVMATGRIDGLTLKWPNDLLLNGGKVAGILLESLGQRQGVAHLAIGIGVNLVSAPTSDEIEPGAVRPVSLVSEMGIAIEPEAFLDLLAASYAKAEEMFLTRGFDAVRDAWLLRAARLGDVITARTGGVARTGTFETVDTQGHLVLRTALGRERIAAADVFF